MSKGSERLQTQAEEVANSVSHGIGFVSAVVATPFLIIHAAGQENTGFLVGASIFCGTLIFLYLSSTLYHALPVGLPKRVFRVIEHAAIFLLIAGTYTPFTLGVLYGVWGWSIFGAIWGMAAIGVGLKVFSRGSWPILSTLLYLLMGWLIVVAVDPLLVKVPEAGLFLLLSGGLFYTVGVYFFATDSQLLFGHLIWHLFVMAGTVCHYFAIYWYAA
ncbi:hemolysin III family protein [Endozoicomonas sp. Mp262]|uniref:PAQR family membrane homeostasis protein TrhA n=1 Tax=Endozoicomonas sp. Mp262 TaxID=2919499 RepID=UPI0021E029B4